MPPNQFLGSEQIISQGLGVLRRELILPRLVTRMGLSDFRGAKDDTVNVRVPALLTAREYEWRTRTAPITYDTLIEESIPVTLDKHPYSAVPVTDEELTLDIRDWGSQVASPQIIAVAELLESYVAAEMVGATYSHAPIAYAEGDGSGAPFYSAAVEARKALNNAKVPMPGRVILLGSDVEAAALKEEGFRRYQDSGSTEALREATIGRVAGFTVIGNVQSLPPDFAIALHPSAFVFANVAPEVPSGAVDGATMVFEDLAMRWIRDYDASYLQDRSVYSAFAGTASVADERDPTTHALTGKNCRAVLFDFTAFVPGP
jgi:hypothetical protein